MKIIACLGNPGKKYSLNRHNIGFIIGEYIAVKAGISINKSSFSSLYGSGKINGQDILFMFPQTYMNLSGDAVSQAMSFFKIKHNDLIVIYDEIELDFGVINIKMGGGHKGHNGIRSIIDRTGSPDFLRFRFGVGRPKNENIKVADYVLSDFSSEEIAAIDKKKDELYIKFTDLTGGTK